MVGAAAAAQYREPWHLPSQRPVLLAELARIAGVEFGCRIQFSMAAPGGIGAQSARTFAPGSAARRQFAQVRRRLLGRRAGMPIGDGRIVVGLDGGYIRDWQDRKTNFEVIVGQSVPEDHDARHVGLVHSYDCKPKRRLFDVLRSQGLQPNQDVTFLTDGGEEIRALTERLPPSPSMSSTGSISPCV